MMDPKEFSNLSPEEQKQKMIDYEIELYRSALSDIASMLQDDAFDNWEDCVQLAEEALNAVKHV